MVPLVATLGATWTTSYRSRAWMNPPDLLFSVLLCMMFVDMAFSSHASIRLNEL